MRQLGGRDRSLAGHGRDGGRRSFRARARPGGEPAGRQQEPETVRWGGPPQQGGGSAKCVGDDRLRGAQHRGDQVGQVEEKFAAIEPLLNERTRRRWAAVEARALGRGGIARVAEATGLSRATISAGLQELAAGPEDDDAAGRLRGPGAGRKALAEHDASLVAALERLVDPATRGDPTGPLRWTCSSAARLSRELQEAGHRVSERSVNRLLHALGYSLQANRKTLEGKQHPDRDAQFNHINRRVRAFQRRRQPVVSVDTKKKELVGPFKNAGREWRPRGQPRAGSGPTRAHSRFPGHALTPTGVMAIRCKQFHLPDL